MTRDIFALADKILIRTPAVICDLRAHQHGSFRDAFSSWIQFSQDPLSFSQRLMKYSMDLSYVLSASSGK